MYLNWFSSIFPLFYSSMYALVPFQVVGDIVVLNAGDKVPADGVVVSGSDVTVNESSLTGEPDDVKKDGPSNPHGDHFLLSGTSLASG